MIIYYQNNVGAFAGNINYIWIGQPLFSMIISAQVVAVSGAANWSSNYNLLLDIID